MKKVNYLWVVTILNSIILLASIYYFARSQEGPTLTEMKEWRKWVVAENQRYQTHISNYVEKNDKVEREYLEKSLDQVYDYMNKISAKQGN